MNSKIKNDEFFHFFSNDPSSLDEPERKECFSPLSEDDKILNVCTYLIIPNRSQPRSVFNGNNIIRLADSIKRYGMLQPLTVRRYKDEGETLYYELVAGERRLRAAKLLGMRTVPCVLIDVDDSRSAELAIIENLLREDLNMFEQAEGFKRLIENHRLTQEEVALRVSMSQSAIANKLRLLRLDPKEREAILEAGLTERHARALIKIADPDQRFFALGHIIAERMNVSATEDYIDSLLLALVDTNENAEKNPEFCEKRPANPSKMDVFYSNLEKSIKNMRQSGCLVSSTREDLEDVTVVTIKISKVH